VPNPFLLSPCPAAQGSHDAASCLCVVVKDGDYTVETSLLHSPRPVFPHPGKIRYFSGTIAKSFGRELIKQQVLIIADMH